MNEGSETSSTAGNPAIPAQRWSVQIGLEHTPRVNFAIQQYGVGLVERVSITNTGESGIGEIAVSVSLGNGECAPWQSRIARIGVGETYHIEPNDLALDARALGNRTEAEKSEIRVEVRSGAELESKSFPIELLPFDQWPGSEIYPELLAAFCTPNHPQIALLLAEAREPLKRVRGSDALDGYQSGSRQIAAQIAEACFNSVRARGLGYINPPASFDRAGQRVRLVDRICREGFGSCLDLSLLLASMWEQAGLHPLILLLEDHAIPAVWTHEVQLPEPAIDDVAHIRNLIELGEVVPVESTMLTVTGSTFAGAVDAAKKRLGSAGASFCAVDILASRKRGVHPLPLRASGDSTGIDLTAARDHGAIPPPGTVLDRVALADRAGATGHATASGSVAGGRVKAWQTKLLDLSLRNRLVSFRQTKRTLELAIPGIARVEDLLADGQRLLIHPKTDGDEAYRRAQLDAGHVYATLTPADCQRHLLELHRAARSSIEETGANVLYLALGMLKWFETAASQIPRYAPLILLPVTLVRSASGEGYRYECSLTEEPIKPNVTLLRKLRQDFAIKTEGLDQFVEDENGVDIDLAIRNFREAIRHTPRWEVEESAHLGLFSFNKFLMWRDLQENLEKLKQSRLVNHLIDPAAKAFDAQPFPRPEELDDQVPPMEMFCTRDADSSQLAAIRAAAQGRTFVLEGPPGTGKSQTIANLIADCLARGKRVLFVAEKMAALSVVRRRLEEDGLGAFCLELHSAKASKKEVLAQLNAGLEATAIDESARWERTGQELAQARGQLNAYVREMHASRDSGESLYEALGRLIALGDGPRAPATGADIAKVSAAQLEGWRAAVAGICERAMPVDPAHEHPLRGIGRAEWSFSLPREAQAGISSLHEAVIGLGERLGAFSRVCGLTGCEHGELSRDAARAIAEIAALLPQSPAPDMRLLVGVDADGLADDLQALVAVGKGRDAERDRLLGVYREEFLRLDHTAHASSVSGAMRLPQPLRMVIGFFVRRRLWGMCVGAVPGLAVLAANLEAARRVKLDSEKLKAAEAGRIVGRRWKDGEAEWGEIEGILGWSRRFRAASKTLRSTCGGAGCEKRLAEIASQGAPTSEIIAAAGEVVKAWNGILVGISAIETVLAPVEGDAFPDPQATGWLTGIARTLSRWGSGLGGLNDWCAWRSARDAANQAGLGELVRLYESGELPRAELGAAFERGHAESWFNPIAGGIPVIRGFNAAGHNRLIERFRELDAAFIRHSRHTVAARLVERTPGHAPQASPQSELGILRRELQKRRAHLPTRRLIESAPNLISRIKPCFLMSPLSVAQYLDAGLPPFDIVVFDEASQIPVWDAIGAIARGTYVIVVGDSKQLPPTSFFDVLGGEEEEAERESIAVEELESILSECNAAGIPRMHLNWHYRSRHESLIAFSNHHYYDNRLHTFPSPVSRGETMGVSLRHVSAGVYDRGGSRTNKVEANLVVEEVVRLLTAGASPDSIGIVTFNRPQQDLIEDLLDARRRENPAIERFFSSETLEPVFVKNLENVQGDERDTIIFSVGYGPDQHGKPSMNFGPLNQDGGERRLNVAITRARKRLVVFSSLTSDQIDLRRTRAIGVHHFKTFLDYAQRGPSAIAEAIHRSGSQDFESGFERAVCRALTDRGWSVDAQVGCAGYRVDLAVRDPQRPGSYLLGIECDGASYHSAKTARDRDRLRQAVLEGLGWRIARVWSTEWRINPEASIAGIERAIAEAAKRAGEAKPDAVPASPAGKPVSSETATQNAAEPPNQASGLFADPPRGPVIRTGLAEEPPEYRHAEPATGRVSGGDIFDAAQTGRGIDAIQRIVDAEGPIVEELAIRRLASWFGVQRITERFRERFAALIQGCLSSQRIAKDDGILWPIALDRAAFNGFRGPGSAEEDRREIEHVPGIERANAAVHVLKGQYSLPREELIRETARVLGVQRVTAAARQLVSEGINRAIAEGRIAERDGRCVAIS